MTIKISLLVEGRTERAFLPFLRSFLHGRLPGRMPKIDPVPFDGRVPKGELLKKRVNRLLDGPSAADYVIALTDVYTGVQPPDFHDADDAKEKMKRWVGDEPRFFPHAAQYEFEAWLLPYWTTIQRLAGHNRASPGSHPEHVNHSNPHSQRLRDIFRIGKRRGGYVKTRDAARILRENDLLDGTGSFGK